MGPNNHLKEHTTTALEKKVSAALKAFSELPLEERLRRIHETLDNLDTSTPKDSYPRPVWTAFHALQEAIEGEYMNTPIHEDLGESRIARTQKNTKNKIRASASYIGLLLRGFSAGGQNQNDPKKYIRPGGVMG